MSLDTDTEFEPLEDDGANAFMEDITGLKRKAPAAEEPIEDADPDEPVDRPVDEPAETEEEEVEEPEGAKTEDPEDPEFELVVGDKTEKVKMSALRTAYAEHAAVKAIEAEVTQSREAARAQTARAEAALTKAVEKAKARYAPYEKLDYLALAVDLERPVFDQLRKEAAEARADLTFYTEELEATMKGASEQAMAQTRESAQRAVSILTGPEDKGGIAGWNQQVYADVLGYAKSNGMTNADKIVDAAAIKVLHKAMLYDKAQKAAATKVVAAKTSATKVMRPAPSGNRTAAAAKAGEAMARLRRSGSADDAANAFLESFGLTDD